MATKPSQEVSIGDGSLHVGDRVVYPNQGICRITGVETKQIAGRDWEVVTLSREEDGATVMVPREKVMGIGLRKVADVAAVEEVFDQLAADGEQAQLDWKVRHRENADRMHGGGLFGTVEVLKGLHALSRIRPLPQKERELYDNARHLLVGEIAAATSIPLHVAEDNLDYALWPPQGMKRKGRTLTPATLGPPPVGAIKVARGDDDDAADDLGFEDEETTTVAAPVAKVAGAEPGSEDDDEAGETEEADAPPPPAKKPPAPGRGIAKTGGPAQAATRLASVHASKPAAGAPHAAAATVKPAPAPHAKLAVDTHARPAVETHAKLAVDTHRKPAVDTHARPAMATHAKPAVDTHAKPAVATHAKPAVDAHAKTPAPAPLAKPGAHGKPAPAAKPAPAHGAAKPAVPPAAKAKSAQSAKAKPAAKKEKAPAKKPAAAAKKPAAKAKPKGKK